MRQHEHGRMEHRVRAPPSRPLVVLPRAALGAELVAPHDLRADVVAPGEGQGVVDAGAAAALPVHLVEAPGRHEPVEEPVARVAER